MGSDHNLIITKVKLRLNSSGKKQEGTIRYEVSKLRVLEVRQQFQIELKNRFSIFQTPDQNIMVTDDHQNSDPSDPANRIQGRWQEMKNAYTETAMNALGRRKMKCQSWISAESWRKIEERRKLKRKIDDVRSERLKNKAQNEYREKDKETKRSSRKDKRAWVNNVAQEADDAARQGHMKGIYEATL